MRMINIQPIAVFLLLVTGFIGVPVAMILKSPPDASKAEYNQLRPGMTVRQVQAIVGHPGHETAGEESANRHIHVYTWVNNDGSLLEATFEGDKLTAKRHERLK